MSPRACLRIHTTVTSHERHGVSNQMSTDRSTGSGYQQSHYPCSTPLYWSFVRGIHVLKSSWKKTTSDTDIFLIAILAGRIKSVLFVLQEIEFLSNTHYMFCGTSSWWRRLIPPRTYLTTCFLGIKLVGLDMIFFIIRIQSMLICCTHIL